MARDSFFAESDGVLSGSDRLNYPLLTADSEFELRSHLVRMGICAAGEPFVGVTRAGEGNMNLVLRVEMPGRSVIVKQSRPWVQKYPSITAPDDRIDSEAAFYQWVAKEPSLAASMPKVLAEDLPHRILVLEDLNGVEDGSVFYQRSSSTGQTLSTAETCFRAAAGWLSRLHEQSRRADPTRTDAMDRLGCRPLLQLNHDHIFTIPFSESPPIDLDGVCDGLTEASLPIRMDDDLVAIAQHLGEVYLGRSDRHARERGVVLHGDFYPGSWLVRDDRVWIIDPEFCCLGVAEFDLGVLLGHWLFCRGAHSDNDDAAGGEVLAWYGDGAVNEDLVRQFAGVEMVRRLLGVAQLPIEADLTTRRRWLEIATGWMRRNAT